MWIKCSYFLAGINLEGLRKILIKSAVDFRTANHDVIVSNFMMKHIHIVNLGGFCSFSSVRKYFIRSSSLPVNMIESVVENRTFVWVQY
jgi:hypothetical protein